MKYDEACKQVQSMTVFCVNESCGDPIPPPMGSGVILRQRRRLDSRGTMGIGIDTQCIYVCPVCSAEKRFSVEFSAFLSFDAHIVEVKQSAFLR